MSHLCIADRMFHLCITVPRFKEEATDIVKVSSLPVSPSFIHCPSKTGPARQDHNADYTRGRPDSSCPQVSTASTCIALMGPHGDSCMGGWRRSKQRTKTYLRASSHSSQVCPLPVLREYAASTQPLMSSNLSYSYQTQETSSNEGLHFTRLCTPRSKSNSWDMGDFQ